jgi:ketosteroid isomerase-like protein
MAGLALGVTFFRRSDAQEADVNKTAEAFHAAISSLDAAKIEALWAHDTSVTLVNPTDKSVSVGGDAVRANWEGITNQPIQYAQTRTS